MGQDWLAHRAALRTKVVCILMRAFRGVGADNSLLCLPKALRARWFMAAAIDATGSTKVRGEPKALISVPHGLHGASSPPMGPPPSSSL